MDKTAVLGVLEEIALCLELLGENPFKTKAYTGAVRLLEKETRSLEELVADKTLGTLKGIGPALEEKITTLVTTGDLPYWRELRASIPAGVFELLKVAGLGPKKARRLWTELGIESLAELEYACRENRLLTLEGFGEKSQAKILDGVLFLKAGRDLRLLADVLPDALALAARLAALPGVEAAELVGSLRRRMPVVRDIDLLLVARDPERAAEAAAAALGSPPVEARGDGYRRLRLGNGLPLDLFMVRPEARVGALVFETGSRAHVDDLVARAAAQGTVLTRAGLRRGGAPVATPDEDSLYRALGLAPVPPEMREGIGELARAAAGPIPQLVGDRSIRGVLHLHTTRSDGAASLRDMALAARDLGFSYLGVSEHSQTATYAGGLSEAAIREQRAEIAALEAEGIGIRILQGIESDILPDGSLDYPPEVLARFDFVIGSIHAAYTMNETAMTARLLTALDNPWLDILGHPTGRILLGRKPIACDMGRVLERAAANGVVVEINANPSRLDLDWSLLPRARELGVRLAIDPDAHSVEGLADYSWGVAMARKGGIPPEMIVNTLPADAFLSALRRNRKKEHP